MGRNVVEGQIVTITGLPEYRKVRPVKELMVETDTEWWNSSGQCNYLHVVTA